MIRSFIFALALGTSLLAMDIRPAFAQSTNQTDQSEEDWRKSQKKRSTTDIFEDITNSRTSGWGITQGPVNPVDSLPEESRRHLMRERARVIANTKPGETVEVEYKPSDAAKTDKDLEVQEKEAWDVIVTDLKGGGQGSSQGQGGPNKIAVTGQGGQNGAQGDNNRGNSTMRGGSSQSVADILAQIKGMKSVGSGSGGGADPTQGAGEFGKTRGRQSGRAQQEQTQQTQGSQAGSRGQQGQSQSQSQNSGQQGQSQAQNQGQSSADGEQSQNQNAGDTETQDSASSDASAQSNSAPAGEQAQAVDNAYSQPQAQPRAEPISPLQRIKNREDRDSSGQRTSASDYLKKSE